MERLEELKQKYQGALNTIQREGVKLTHLHIQDNKLFMQGAAPSENIKNDVWNQIKATDASYNDLICELSVDTSLPQPSSTATAAAAGASGTRTYTVQSGDTLSKISQQFYGKANEYNRIFEANRDKLSDPDKVRAGQELTIPN
jgi:LysM repeat protein